MELYDEVLKDLQTKITSLDELFAHCMKTCRKLIDKAEDKLGNGGKNIDDIQLYELGALYDDKLKEFIDDMPTGKYDYSTTWEDFSSSSHISRYDFKKNCKNNNGEEIDYIYDNYFEQYFGIKYGKNYDVKVRYELIRLLKILCDCKKECDIDLGSLIRNSVVKYRPDIPSKYRDAINYIKMRLVLRKNDNNGYHMSFTEIMQLENQMHAVKNFVNTIHSKAVDNIIADLVQSTYSPSQMKREVNDRVCESINAILKTKDYNKNKIMNNPDFIQAYAYRNLFNNDIYTTIKDIGLEKSSNNKSNFVIVDDYCYDIINSWRSHADSQDIPQPSKVSDMEEFVEKYKGDIAGLVFPKEKNNNNGSIRKLNAHMHMYEIMRQIYSIYIEGDNKKNLDEKDAILMIALYEKMSSDKIEIPLYSGYTEGRRDSLKIMGALKKIESFLLKQENNSSFDQEKYYIASYFICNCIHMNLRRCDYEMMNRIDEMKISLLKYWNDIIPVMTNEGVDIDLNGFAEDILPVKKRDEIKAIVDDMYCRYVILGEGTEIFV